MAKELSQLTGESMTAAVNEAIRERLDRVRGQSGEDIAERLLKIGRECASRLKESHQSMEIDDLYDEKGLPK